MADFAAPRRSFGVDSSLSPEDFETASIRSAAPSYISDAPSYHTNVSSTEPIPPYTRHDPLAPLAPLVPPPPSSLLPPPSSSTPTPSNLRPPPSHCPHTTRAPTLPPPSPNDAPTVGLPPIPPAPPRRAADPPTLGAFRIPSWSTISSNPAALRQYRSVANRRAVSSRGPACSPVASAGAASDTASGGPAVVGAGAAAPGRRLVLDRIEEEENHRRRARSGSDTRVRPLEDPYLVGEVAARQAREERLAREAAGGSGAVRATEPAGPGAGSMLLEDGRRWDWFLGTFQVPARLPSRLNVGALALGAGGR